MLRFLLKVYWELNRWKIAGSLPKEYKKMILVVAPHTSWKDVFVGLAARYELKIDHAKFLGKKELFDGVFGRLFRNLGGIPVDRFGTQDSKQSVVDQAVRLFNENDNFILGISPEGTRKRVEKLKTGFYQIAKNANIPIVLVGFDFKNKQVVLREPIFVSDNQEADFKKFIAFFSTIQGAKPELGLGHLHVEP
ncbi:MAG: 1-acyl-sn-glycerol-3-phosphate acyltransferase [Ginsengibacter sp.]